jgi:hypothetical protein
MLSVCVSPFLALVYRHDSGEVTHDYDGCCFATFMIRERVKLLCCMHTLGQVLGATWMRMYTTNKLQIKKYTNVGIVLYDL